MGIATQEMRDLAIHAHEAGESVAAISRVLGKSQVSINRWLKRYRETGSSAAYKRGHRAASLNAEQLKQVELALQKDPDVTLKQLKESLNLPCHITTLNKTIHRLGYRYKKKSTGSGARAS